MEIFGKNIKLFLLDGTPTGRWICELSNWTGVAYKIPRSIIKVCENRIELLSSGVYFLFGEDDKENKPLVYIGEAENIMTRLKQHLDSKDYWNEVIVFISKDDNLNKAYIKYLENRFYELAIAAKRYVVKNANTPTRSNISEAEQAEMEEFLYNAKLLISTLGHKTFEPLLTEKQIEDKENLFVLNFTCTAGTGGSALGKVTDEGFVVLQGSYINPITRSSLYKGAVVLREKLKKDNKINDENKLMEDVLFGTPSGASCLVLGRSSNGLTEWKTKEGKTLKEIEKEDIKNG